MSIFNMIRGAVQSRREGAQGEREKDAVRAKGPAPGLVDDADAAGRNGATSEMAPANGHAQAQGQFASSFQPLPPMQLQAPVLGASMNQQGAEQQAHQAAANQMGSMFAAPSLETADYNAMMAQRRRGY